MKIIQTTLPNGYKVDVIEKSQTIINEVWDDKCYEKNFTISSGMTIIDIGANQGFFSLYAASKGAKIYAYEPEEQNFKILHKNVTQNNLEDSIKCIKLAIGKERGNIKLYIHDYELPFASGMVTASKSYLENINEINTIYSSNQVKIQNAECITLLEAISSINSARIDLLKIDCEGSELEILSGISKNDMERVDNIVLETHNSYPPSEIYWKIQDLGFTIKSYKKPSKKYLTGYIFAVNSKYYNTELTNLNPIIILKMPKRAIIGEKITIDASQSFSTKSRENRLTYKWYINDELINEASSKIDGYTFNNTGRYLLTVEIIDGNNSSKEKNPIWVFSNEYFKEQQAIELPMDKITSLFIHKKNNFIIKSNEIPFLWDFNKIIISFKTKKTFIKRKINFLFDNESSILDNLYTEKVFLDFPESMDLKFSLQTKKKQKIGIKWWTGNKNVDYISDEEILEYSKKNITCLSPASEPLIIEIADNKDFVIHKKMLPQNWKPSQIVLLISPIKPKKTKIYLEFQEIKEKIKPPFVEIKIPIEETRIEYFFKLSNIKKKYKIRIVWWTI
jgi:FkbM family methyltransferase